MLNKVRINRFVTIVVDKPDAQTPGCKEILQTMSPTEIEEEIRLHLVQGVRLKPQRAPKSRHMKVRRSA